MTKTIAKTWDVAGGSILSGGVVGFSNFPATAGKVIAYYLSADAGPEMIPVLEQFWGGLATMVLAGAITGAKVLLTDAVRRRQVAG